MRKIGSPLYNRQSFSCYADWWYFIKRGVLTKILKSGYLTSFVFVFLCVCLCGVWCVVCGSSVLVVECVCILCMCACACACVVCVVCLCMCVFYLNVLVVKSVAVVTAVLLGPSN